jgi:Domain of unknown function (DUF4349)
MKVTLLSRRVHRKSRRTIGSGASTRASKTLAGSVLAGTVLASTLLLIAGCSGAASRSSAAPSAVSRAAARAAPGTARSATLRNGATGHGPAARLLLSNQSIIYTANLTVQPRNVAAAADQAIRIATSAGGYLAGEQATTIPGHPDRATVSLTLKIPVPRYQTVVARLSALGKRTSLSQRAVNVTQQVADIGSRVASQRVAIAQLRALLKRAGSVNQLLTVQDQINAEESSLEALLAQQRALAHETSYGTVSVLLVSQPRPPVHHKKAPAGFLAGLSRGWHAFVTAMGWLATALGAVLPFAAIVAILAALGLAGRRRVLRRRGLDAGTSTPSAT